MTEGGSRRFIPAHIPISAVYQALMSPKRFYEEQLVGIPQNSRNHGGGLNVPHPDLTRATVGDVGHEAVAGAVQEGLSKQALENGGPGSAEVAMKAIDATAPEVDAEVQTVLVRWTLTHLFPQLAQSDLWLSLEDATTVKVEYPVATSVTVDDVSVRLHGRADLLYERAGIWNLADLKISPVTKGDLLLKYIAQTTGYAFTYSDRHQTSIEDAQIVFLGDNSTTVNVDVNKRVPELVGAVKNLSFRSDAEPFEPVYDHELPWSADDFRDTS